MILDALPRRIILSRKGSDATWGGRPSLRVGKELISLPIPESASRTAAAEATGRAVRYRDLPGHSTVGSLGEHLRDITPERCVHLDPDLRPELRPLGHAHDAAEQMFGQEAAAERHLRLQAVGPGDLFLFFGWFREAVPEGGGWRRTGADEHTIWGWLQIDESYPVGSAEEAAALQWAAHHPHVMHWDRYDRHNRLYRARKQLSFAPDLPGAGVFDWHPALTLTRRCEQAAPTRGQWCLPGFFRQTGLTYHEMDVVACQKDRRRIHLRSAPIGQEFVAPAHRPFRKKERANLAKWLGTLFVPMS